METPGLKEIFSKALDWPPSPERAAYLDRACRGDASLRAQVESLLEDHGRIGRFLASSAGARGSDVPDTERSDPEPGTVIGPYKLLQPLGEGGMGAVFMAEQTTPVRRMVALKVIKAGLDSRQVLARFEAERQALARMDHPNIARVLDAGSTESGRPYFVMELVKGIPITAFCDENRLGLRERLELLVPVCQAVQHAHQKGVIHRDIKPSNVLVALYDGRPVPKVIDFGVAKATRERLVESTLFTEFGSVIGTLEYMSPEQAQLNALDIDTRSDVYALGVLLYELLTGTTPFPRQRLRQAALDELLRVIREEEPPRPSARLSGSGPALADLSARRRADPDKLPGMVRGELDWIVMKALEKDRARRYETADALARDLQHHLADEPVEACPPSAWYRLRKLARRCRRALAIAAAFALLLFLAAAVSTGQAVRATRAERQARAERDRAKAAELRAREEQANAQAALDFLWKDVLSQASYRNHPDRDLKLRTVLDRVAARIERGPGQPRLVEAAIRQMLGVLYIDLGECHKAQPLLEEALKIQLRELGEEDPRTLATMHHLGHCFYRMGHADAARLLGRTLELRCRVLGDDHDDTLLTARHAAATYANLGRHDEAERLLRRTLEARRHAFGERHRETVVTMYWLAGQLVRRGRLAEAETLAVQCVDQSRRLADDDQMVGLFARSTLAGVYIARGKPAPAEPLAVQVVEETRRLLGDRHPFTVKALHRLARVYQLQGRYAEAAPHLAEALATAREVHRSDHPQVFTTLHLLGRNLLGERKYAEAEQVLRECLEGLDRWQPIAPQRAGLRALVQGLVGESLLRQRRYAEAEPLLLAAYEAQNARRDASDAEETPPQERREIQALKRLVRLYRAWDDPGRAESWRQELAARTERADGKGSGDANVDDRAMKAAPPRSMTDAGVLETSSMTHVRTGNQP